MIFDYLDNFEPDQLAGMPLPELIPLIQPFVNDHTRPYNICSHLINWLLDDLKENLADLFHNANYDDAADIMSYYTNRIQTIATYMKDLE